MVLLSKVYRYKTVGRQNIEGGSSETRWQGENESEGCRESSSLCRKVVGVDERIHGRCVGAVAWKRKVFHRTKGSRVGLREGVRCKKDLSRLQAHLAQRLESTDQQLDHLLCMRR